MPAAIRRPLANQHAFRRNAGPMHEALSERARILSKPMRRAGVDDAVAAPLERDIRRAKANVA